MTRKFFAVLTMLVIPSGLFATSPAAAHSFNVALIIAQPETGGRQTLNGFMLATEERDSHAGQESDGHLGGLDVYVNVIDAGGDVISAIRRIPERGEGAADIVIALAPEKTQTRLLPALETFTAQRNIPLLLPGKTPFANAARPGVSKFIRRYKERFSSSPTPMAATGYNAARRIDRAVRADGGAGDSASLKRSFTDTAMGFGW